MTIEKDRSHAIWEGVELPSYKKVSMNLKADVCVVGGGMSGVSLAYELGKRGHKVILLEASRIASGQSGRTTAHLTYQLEEPFCRLVKNLDKEKVQLFAQAHRQAIDVIEDRVFEENISCDFRRLDGYLFLGSDDSIKTLQEEVKIGYELGLDLMLSDQIPAFPQLGPAVIFPRQGQFHPLKYMRGLLKAMERMDVTIFEDSHVKDFKTGSGVSRVVTDDGFEIESVYLVVATDSPVNNRFYIHTKQAAYRTYVLGFKFERQIEIPLMWDTDDPYHYIRQCGSTVIIGGEDHRTGQGPEQDPYEELEKWSRQRFPLLGEVQWTWSGQVFEPVDQMGFIGRNPGIEKNVFITTGESGIGMTSAAIASMLIPDLIDHKDNPWAALLDPGRVTLKASTASEFIKENANIALQYTDWVKPAEAKTLEEIPRDHGSLMQDRLSKNCVYHTSDDHFEKKSAICTHLGGIVHWNDLEKTWDCPCHGSRFNAHGQVIEGPALNNLMEP